MDSKRCSNGKEMIKEHFLTTFHNMNSTAFLRFTGQFKGKKKKKEKLFDKTHFCTGELIAPGAVEAKRIKGFREIHGGQVSSRANKHNCQLGKSWNYCWKNAEYSSRMILHCIS